MPNPIKNRKELKISGLAVLSLALIFFIGLIFISEYPAAAAGTKKAPDFNLRVLNPAASGYADFSLKNFKGHIIIINFWATWCPYCRHEIPMIKNFYKSERSKGVIVIGINVNDSPAGVRSFVKEYDIKYPVVYASSGVISSYGGVNGLPQTFFISKTGNIMFHWVGEISRGALYGITDKLLKMN